MFKKFEIVVCKCGSLEVIQRYVIEDRNVDNARLTGIIRSQSAGYFVGAQRL